MYENVLTYRKVLDDLYNPNYNENLSAKKKTRRLTEGEECVHWMKS